MSTPSPSPTNVAILREVQAMAAQLAQVTARLNEADRPKPKLATTLGDDFDDYTAILRLNTWDPESFFSGESYNTIARLHNSTVRHGSDTLIPLRSIDNKVILGCPSTLGHLAHLDPNAADVIRKAYGIGPGLSLSDFMGVGARHLERAGLRYILPEEVLLSRIHRRLRREAEKQAAGEPTWLTRTAATDHNVTARQKNKQADSGDYPLVPIHDERNLPVPGFPGDLQELLRPLYLAEVLYLLKEYEQPTEVKGCVFRWKAFVGVETREEEECYYHCQKEWLL